MHNRKLTWAAVCVLILGAAIFLSRNGSIDDTQSLESGARDSFEYSSTASSSGNEYMNDHGLPQEEPGRIAQQIENSWVDRYPQAEVVETRLKHLGNDRYRFQSLLKTVSRRIPWVLWEDKLVKSPSGEFAQLGSVAHVGNAFIAEADLAILDEARLATYLEDHNLEIERESRLTNYLCLRFDDPSLGKLEALIAAYQAEFPFALAELDTLSFPSVLPDDWSSSRMWGLDMISAPDAWDIEKGETSDDVVIAVIDTGLQIDHPDIAGNLFELENDFLTPDQIEDKHGWDFENDDSITDDVDGHGTHVAGIVGASADNGVGAVGVNWRVKILPLKVGDADGLRTFAINDALAYVAKLRDPNGDGVPDGINIVATNNSYGSGGSNFSTRRAIRDLEALDVLFVAAAGNDGIDMDVSEDTLEFPAGYDLDSIISVANSNQEDALNVSSNYGAISVDLSAPGSEIYSTYPTNSYAYLTGTSMSSPMVAGAVALLAKLEPELTGTQIKARLMETGDPLESQNGLTKSGRRLNILSALKPSLAGHRLEISNLTDSTVILDEVGSTAIFRTDSHPEAEVTVTILSGDAVETPEDLGDGIFRFVAVAEGLARIRLTSTLEGVTRSLEKSIVVGAANAVTNGLVHHFTFDGVGGSVNDLASPNSGTITGASRELTEFGTSLRFDAATENMTFDGQFSDQVTIAALVRADNLAASPHPRILNMPFYYLYFSSGEGPGVPDGNRQTLKFFSNYSDFGVWNAPPRSISEGEWYYVVGTYDSTDITNTPKLYINGESQVVRLQQDPKGSMVKTGGASFVGNNEAGDRSFNGLIGDVRVYDRELSPEEVTQLGAFLVRRNVGSLKISGPETIGFGTSTAFSLENIEEDFEIQSVDWYLEDLEGGVVSARSTTEVDVSVFSPGEYKLLAQVSDGLVTRVYSKSFQAASKATYYEATTETGGLAYLEVSENLDTGFISIFDLESGFYRINEPVLINESGAFATLENSSGSVSGVVSSFLSGEVGGYGLSFSGSAVIGEGTSFDQLETYEGGAVGVVGDSIVMRILSDERVYLIREGDFPDIAFGSLEEDGTLALLSASGQTVTLSPDEERGSMRGTWGEQSVYLKNGSSANLSQLWAGFTTAPLSAGLGGGMFAEFVGLDETPSLALAKGEFSSSEDQLDKKFSKVLVREDGSSFRSKEPNLNQPLAESASQQKALYESRAVSLIRAQIPLFADEGGAVGFSIVGDEPMEVFVRALGPLFGENGSEDPKIVIHKVVGESLIELGENDDWRDGALFTEPGESSQGAFRKIPAALEQIASTAMEDDAKDAAFRIWLDPGYYQVTAEISAGAGGNCLIEVYGL